MNNVDMLIETVTNHDSFTREGKYLLVAGLKMLQDYARPKSYSADMMEPVRCPECGDVIAYGDGYTSRTEYVGAFGITVCERCYERECRENEEIIPR